jgi:hypothetical protein
MTGTKLNEHIEMPAAVVDYEAYLSKLKDAFAIINTSKVNVRILTYCPSSLLGFHRVASSSVPSSHHFSECRDSTYQNLML